MASQLVIVIVIIFVVVVVVNKFIFFRPTFLEPFQTSYILKSPIIVESLADLWIRIFYLLLLFFLYSPLPQRGRDEGKSGVTIA